MTLGWGRRTDHRRVEHALRNDLPVSVDRQQNSAQGTAARRERGADELCQHCSVCVHWLSECASLEAGIPGLISLGSGFGASVADARLCLVHDRLTGARDRCLSFVRQAAAVTR
jgi:hypothetical protein